MNTFTTRRQAMVAQLAKLDRDARIKPWNINQLAIYKTSLEYNFLVAKLNDMRESMIHLNTTYRLDPSDMIIVENGSKKRPDDVLIECLDRMPDVLSKIEIPNAKTFDEWIEK